MPGPVAFGVHRALERERDRRRPRRPPRFALGEGWGVFVVASLGLSWLAAGLLGDVWQHRGDTLGERLLSASLYYALTMGWSPLVAVWLARHWRNARWRAETGWRAPRSRDVGIAMLIATGLPAAAMALARLSEEPAQVQLVSSSGAGPALAALGALFVLCLQAVTEEVGWRGAPLTYAVERWGRAGLVLHGAVWGLWYAPLLVHDSLGTAVGFVITCMLLGIVFGWLRLRSGSVLPSAIANALLTIIAGLPVLLRDGSVGIRDAVFRWPGWPILGVLAVIVLVMRKHELGLEPRAHGKR